MATRSNHRHQVVGVDASPGSKHALAWAIARSEYLGPVEPVSVWQYPWWAFVPTATSTVFPLNEDEFDAVARGLVDESLEGLDRGDVRDTVIVHGSAGPALVSAGSEASLIVVGTRGHGKLVSGLVGSVSRHCVSHATVPVAVIPADTPPDDRFQSVVVGFDGSGHAERALEWALDNTPPATEIKIVHVWNPSATATAQTTAMTSEQLSAQSSAIVDEAIERLRTRPGSADRQLTAHSESGDPRAVLRSISQRADLVVVGARGRGGVTHLLLGSVSSALANQPAAATVVVR